MWCWGFVVCDEEVVVVVGGVFVVRVWVDGFVRRRWGWECENVVVGKVVGWWFWYECIICYVSLCVWREGVFVGWFDVVDVFVGALRRRLERVGVVRVWGDV